jgi:hypothetical protein
MCPKIWAVIIVVEPILGKVRLPPNPDQIWQVTTEH